MEKQEKLLKLEKELVELNKILNKKYKLEKGDLELYMITNGDKGSLFPSVQFVVEILNKINCTKWFPF